MEIPNGWEDLTLSQYSEYALVEESDYNSKYSYIFNRLAVLLDMDIDDEEFENISTRKALEMFEAMPWVKNKPFSDTFSSIMDYQLIPVEKITIGTFIDIEYYLNNGRDFSKIAVFLYRKVKTGEWGEKLFEPVDTIPIEERAFMFGNLPVTQVYGAIQSYLNWRAALIQANKGSVFEEDELDDPLEEEFEDDDIDTEGDKKEKLQAHWNWELVLYTLAGKDKLKMLEAANLPAIYAFNLLNMSKDLELS